MTKFHWRRIPGTLALALTNLIAGIVVFSPEQFDIGITVVLTKYASAQTWGIGFLVAGLLLVLAAITRRWGVLNTGSATSLFLWIFASGVIVQAWVVGTISMTAIGLALLFWMVFGQATMLFAPLWARGRGYE